jgi:hypothetical protein
MRTKSEKWEEKSAEVSWLFDRVCDNFSLNNQMNQIEEDRREVERMQKTIEKFVIVYI